MFRLVTGALVMLSAQALFGGVKLDGSLGPRVALPGPNYLIPANFGKQVGTNLFQSFSQFNLVSSESATFTGPNNIQNILSRVTSGSASSIDGKISSQIHGANLFFLNPAGVMFGPHAQLDVSGSFAVTTANYLKFVGGGRFNANLGGQDTLTSAPVNAFGFLDAKPASIMFQQSQLAVPLNTGLRVFAGDVTLDGASLTAPGGTLAIVSLGSGSQEVPSDISKANATAINPSGRIAFRNNSLASIDSAVGGGALELFAGDISLDNSTVSSTNSGSTIGGSIFVQGHDAVSVLNGSRVISSVVGSGPGGVLEVNAGTLTVDGDNGTHSSSIRSSADAGSGPAGMLNLIADQITLSRGGQIDGSSFSEGHGGNVTITANAIDISGTTPLAASGIFAEANSTGDAGTLDLTVGHALTIAAGGLIAVDTFGSGTGGILALRAESLNIDGSAAPGAFTGISAQSNASAQGNAGDLTIKVGGLTTIEGHGEIVGATRSSGKGGISVVESGSMIIDGSAATPGVFTGIGSQTLGAGDAGNLTVRVAGLLEITAKGAISTDTFSKGLSGNLFVQAGSLMIDGSAASDQFTGISAGSASGATGNGGNLTVNVDGRLSITGAGQIAANTSSSGKGGDLAVHAGSLAIDGSAAPDAFTGIRARSERGASGDAGRVTVNVDGGLDIKGAGKISASTFSSGKGGDLAVHAGSLAIDGSAAPDQFTGISATSEDTATGDAGDLTVSVDHALTVRGTGEISAGTFSSGKGGDLTVHAGSLLIEGSAAAAAAQVSTGITVDSNPGATGDAGNLRVIVNGPLRIFASGSITADTSSTGRGGDLTVHAGSLFIDGSATAQFLTGFTGISADSTQGATGDAGELQVTVDGALTLRGSGTITADTNSIGRGGDLTVHAGSILIDGSGAAGFFTGISTEADAGTGKGGNVTVTAGDVRIRGGGSISASSVTSAPAGSVRLTVGKLSLDGSDVSSFNGDGGTGPAGDVVIQASGPIRVSGGSELDTSSDFANAGSLKIISGGPVELFDHSAITASAGANGGNIQIRSPQLLYLLDSQITATAGTSGIGGTGGNITIDPTFIVLNNSLISANAAAGRGGNINLISDFFFNSTSLITATGTTNGTINITAPALDLGAELITLPGSLVSGANQLQERCTALLQGDFSSFISIGRGGTEPEPDELESEF